MKKIAFLMIILNVMTGCMEAKKTLVIGHRGAMGHETENTLASVQKAIDQGVDMIEIDVFNIKSGETVVFHDEKLDRLTNAGGNIEEWNYFDLRKVIVGEKHKIPTLQEVLKLINHQVRLNIELKGDATADRVNFITNYYIEKEGWKVEDFLISSFKWNELRDIRKLNKNIPIAILTEEDPVGALEIAKELNAEAINPYFKTLNAANNLTIQKAGFKIYPWTVNEPNDILEMKRLGVDGIITNYPERIK